ncbi:hypothetical protein JX265_005701 [Neoarthrinium moseri]|uniref:Uncharacterized protein n=1 Tax=Neoarthrinium moseri TaxID=1658444 RepID=A0A9P9WN54_9PEZI|nr:uncharacterized protein JN550_008441 [Neoarthrinium moseri]KAI1848672.1 hypothetical protein JX266_005531 [Neoarthrinium moseri]KAI1865393.1 hypothetical protein JN550_008441 [Neoarthrinium moseri]KAI1871715.1 hypothetical protein JX265_005701 [Neoarthrinium moseri]
MSSAQSASASLDQPNPIAAQYPDLVSGTLNGTTMIVPIALELARQLIPGGYAILEQSFRSLLPSFPAGMYPMMVSAKHDHDIQLPAYNLSIPDFTRAAFEFPFLDLSGDGHTPYRLQDTVLMTASNQGAISGAAGYGIKVYPADLDPPNDGYRSDGNGGNYFSATSVEQVDGVSKFLTVASTPCAREPPYPIEFIKNITNQVVFANSSVCDNYQLLFNTSLTAPPFEPQPVTGTVTGLLEPFTTPQTWTGVFGWNYATAFLEPIAPQACPKASS